MTHLHPGILRKFSLPRETAGGGPSDGAISQTVVRKLGALGSPKHLVKVHIARPPPVCTVRISGGGPRPGLGICVLHPLPKQLYVHWCLIRARTAWVSQALEAEALFGSFSPSLCVVSNLT